MGQASPFDPAAAMDPAREALIARLAGDAAWRLLCVLGPTDAGKTTLCRQIGVRVAAGLPTMAVDGDPGQSSLGPPACLALAAEPWQGEGPLALRFVGSTSPAGHFLQTLTGIKRLVEHAFAQGSRRVVFDSSGYMADPAGREFHHQVVDMLSPDHLVVLQRADELEPLLATFVHRACVLHRLPVPAAARPRSPERRREYRRERFARYFRNAGALTLALAGVGRHGMLPERPEQAPGCLVALCDRRGFTAALGIVESMDEQQMRLWAPPLDCGQVASVQFSRLRLDPSGRQV